MSARAVRVAVGVRRYSWEKRGPSMYHLCREDGVPVCGFEWAVRRESAPYFTVNENSLGAGRKPVCWKCVDVAVNVAFGVGLGGA